MRQACDRMMARWHLCTFVLTAAVPKRIDASNIFTTSPESTLWPWQQPQALTGLPKDFYAITVPPADAQHDDTVALQTSINASADFQVVFVPDGTYRISDTLTRWGPAKDLWKANRFFLRGSTVVSTVIRLADASPTFGDPAVPKPMFHCGDNVAQDFDNVIQNIRFDCGRNRGATAMQFMSNNMGAVRNVTLLGDSSAAIGLDMAYSDQIGPLLVKWLYVRGFGTSIATGHNVDSMTFENLWLENPRHSGINNTGQVISVRQLFFRGTVPAVWQHSAEANVAFLTLTDSHLVYGGAGLGMSSPRGANAAIVGNGGMMYIRNLRTSGFSASISHENAVPPAPPSPVFCSNSTLLPNRSIVQAFPLQSIYNQNYDTTMCCSACENWNGSNSSCTAWTLDLNPKHDNGACFLFHCYGGAMKDCKLTESHEAVVTGLVHPALEARQPVQLPVRDSVLIEDANVREWTSHGVAMLFHDSANHSMNLTWVGAPEPPLSNAAEDWIDGLGPSMNCSCKEIHDPSDPKKRIMTPDCSPLLQQAMDSGKPVVYIGQHNTSTYCKHDYHGLNAYAVVTVPKTVKHFLMAQLTRVNLTIAEGGPEDGPLIIEGMANDGSTYAVHHTSKRPLVFRDMCGVQYTTDCSEGSGPAGDLFFDDVCTNGFTVCNGQNVWAVQLNTESAQLDINVTGKGSQLFVHGYKVERGQGGLVNVSKGARLQVDGTFAYTTSSSYVHSLPAFAVMDAEASITYREYNADCKPFLHPIFEQRGDDKKVLSYGNPQLILGHGNSICQPPKPSTGVCLFSAVPLTVGEGAELDEGGLV